MCGAQVRPARAHLRGPGGAGSRCSRRAGRAELGAQRERRGAGSPEHSRAATARTAAPRRPWPGPAPALLRATCRRRLLRAARRLPSARPMGGGRHFGAERRGTTRGSRTGPRRAEPPSLHAPPPRGRPPPGFLHLAVATAAPPLPGPCKGRGARREEELEVRAAREGAQQPGSQPSAPLKAP